jgi:putative hydrolase of the HAD superfamily
MSPRAADAALVVDLDGVLRIWDPEIVASAEHGPVCPRAHSTARRSPTRPLCGPSSPAGSATPSGAPGSPHGWSPSTGRPRPERWPTGRAPAGRSTSASSPSSGSSAAPVALPSNATDRLPRDLQRLGLDGELDAVVNSSELGLAKPDPEVFVAVCSALGLPPYRCLFVDDQQVNVDAAARVGLRAHLYRGPGELAAVLQDGSG